MPGLRQESERKPWFQLRFLPLTQCSLWQAGRGCACTGEAWEKGQSQMAPPFLRCAPRLVKLPSRSRRAVRLEGERQGHLESLLSGLAVGAWPPLGLSPVQCMAHFLQ